jgi:glycine/D-amino acid oxidase-like deaminating enzyme
VLLSDAEVEARVDYMRRMLAQPGMPQYEWRLIGTRELRCLVPGIGPAVRGAIWCRHDGHVNPLKLLRALHTALARAGVAYKPRHGVTSIAPHADGFRLETAAGPVHAAKIVLAAGLDNARLAPMVGIAAPVRPQRGQILVLERMQPLLRYPITTLRQTDEGSILVGDSQEEAGYRDSVGLPVLATLAERAVQTYPALRHARVVRTWGALRVMSADGFPIYARSATHPGAFLATCHSGVTLAAAHAYELAPAVARGTLPDLLAPFSDRRFAARAVAPA